MCAPPWAAGWSTCSPHKHSPSSQEAERSQRPSAYQHPPPPARPRPGHADEGMTRAALQETLTSAARCSVRHSPNILYQAHSCHRLGTQHRQ